MEENQSVQMWKGSEMAELIKEALCRKVALTLVLKEMMDAGRAGAKESMSKLLSSLIFKVGHRKDRCIQL